MRQKLSVIIIIYIVATVTHVRIGSDIVAFCGMEKYKWGR